MAQIWYMDMSSLAKDPKEDLKCQPNRPFTVKELFQKTGVEYFHLPLPSPGGGQDRREDPQLTAIRHDRKILFDDEVDIRPGTLPNFDQQVKNFFTEHLHADQEIRYCLDGSGYFDVRDGQDDWIRIELNPGDLIILPAGIYHRFTLDKKNYLKAKRYYTDGPRNIPHNRPADTHLARVEYKKRFLLQSAPAI